MFSFRKIYGCIDYEKENVVVVTQKVDDLGVIHELNIWIYELMEHIPCKFDSTNSNLAQSFLNMLLLSLSFSFSKRKSFPLVCSLYLKTHWFLKEMIDFMVLNNMCIKYVKMHIISLCHIFCVRKGVFVGKTFRTLLRFLSLSLSLLLSSLLYQVL